MAVEYPPLRLDLFLQVMLKNRSDYVKILRQSLALTLFQNADMETKLKDAQTMIERQGIEIADSRKKQDNNLNLWQGHVIDRLTFRVHPSDQIMDFSRMPLIRDLSKRPSSQVKLVRSDEDNVHIIVQSQIPPAGEESKFALKHLQTAVLLSACSHPCFLRFVGWSFPSAGIPGQIGLEYAERGSLCNLLNERRLFRDETLIAIITCAIVIGMNYLHCRGIMHRNLRPETVFLDSIGDPKIGGLHKACRWSDEVTLSRGISSPLYMAPEMYASNTGDENDENYTETVDVYSFGLILYEMITGKPVYPPDTPLTTLASLASGTDRPKLPPTLNRGVRTIIRQCWSADPEARSSFDVIWRQLANLDFKITSNVDSACVLDYIRKTS
jgi:serine/threonine protein kinase